MIAVPAPEHRGNQMNPLTLITIEQYQDIDHLLHLARTLARDLRQLVAFQLCERHIISLRQIGGPAAPLYVKRNNGHTIYCSGTRCRFMRVVS